LFGYVDSASQKGNFIGRRSYLNITLTTMERTASKVASTMAEDYVIGICQAQY
jgi:hypothetical protein